MFSLCVSSPGEQEQAVRKKNGDGPIPTSSGTTITREQERDARDGPIAMSSGTITREQERDARDGPIATSSGPTQQEQERDARDGPIATSSGPTQQEQERDARDGPIATSSGTTQQEQDAHDGGPHEEEGGTTRKKDGAPDEEGPERTSKGAEEEERTKGAAEEPVKGGGGVDSCLWSVLGSITGKKPEEEREGQRVEEQSGRAFVKCECGVCRGRAGCTGKVGVLPPTELCTDVWFYRNLYRHV